jgi:hypothetical protein
MSIKLKPVCNAKRAFFPLPSFFFLRGERQTLNFRVRKKEGRGKKKEGIR